MNTYSSLRPASGATRRVWEIADQLTRESGTLAKRKVVIDRFVAEGGNANTASTQFHYWKCAQEEVPTEAPSSLGPVRLAIGLDGRVVIPAELRRAMALDESGAVSAEIVEGELRMVSSRIALQRLQHLLRPLRAGSESVVDEFLSERKALWGEDE